eukprot:m.76877 g.76877  ORF g.76877 m.76877 type:complete len:98 (+) comp19060_c0_seq3:4150-4443(+)
MGSTVRHLVEKGASGLSPFDFLVIFIVYYSLTSRFKPLHVVYVTLICLIMMELPYSQSYTKRLGLIDPYVATINTFYNTQVAPHVMAGYEAMWNATQ